MSSPTFYHTNNAIFSTFLFDSSHGSDHSHIDGRTSFKTKALHLSRPDPTDDISDHTQLKAKPSSLHVSSIDGYLQQLLRFHSEHVFPPDEEGALHHDLLKSATSWVRNS